MSPFMNRITFLPLLQYNIKCIYIFGNTNSIALAMDSYLDKYAYILAQHLLQVKDIENLAIILVPLIMILSRGHTEQIKG